MALRSTPGLTGQSAFFHAGSEKNLKRLFELTSNSEESNIEMHNLMLFDPTLILKQNSFLEKNGREWKNISPLQYAAWAGDISLVKYFLTFIPKDKKIEAAKQLEAIIERKKTDENGAYLAPYRALINALIAYRKQFNIEKNKEQLEKLQNSVDEIRKLLPICGQKYYDKSISAFGLYDSIAINKTLRDIRYFYEINRSELRDIITKIFYPNSVPDVAPPTYSPSGRCVIL